MTALSKSIALPQVVGESADYALAASKVYMGSMVGLNSSTGYARAFTIGDKFVGHSQDEIDNSAGSAGDRRVPVLNGKYRLQVSLSGVAITDAVRRAPVYAQDDATLSLRYGQSVGRVVKYVSSGVAIVEFDTEATEHILAENMLFSGFTDGGSTSGYKDFATQIPEGCNITGWQADVRTGFTGDTTAVVQVGVSGNTDRFSVKTTNSVLAADVVGGSPGASSTDYSYLESATTVRVTVTGGADFTSIAAGEMDMKIFFGSRGRQ